MALFRRDVLLFCPNVFLRGVALWRLTAVLRCRNSLLHHDQTKRLYKRELDKRPVTGRAITVLHSTALKSRQRMCDRDKTILVGNIHSCVTEEILFELFLQAGPVDEVRIFRDGQQALYGCVRYKHAEAVPYAVALLDGIWLYGQPIKLQRKTDGHYHRNEAIAYHMGNGLIADSAAAVHWDDVVLNLSGSPAVGIHYNEAHGWRDMVYSRRLDVCPPAVWFCPPLQQWLGSGHPSGTSCLHENASLHGSASSRVSCANRPLYRGCCASIPTPYAPVSAFSSTDSDRQL